MIVSTGDISDIDGFYALAEYAKTGSDVMFIMSYPAYIVVDGNENEERPFGLGYSYSATEVLKNVKTPSNAYSTLMAQYGGSPNEQMKDVLTDLGFEMARNVWNELNPKGNLYYCIGGVNAINPYSANVIKNEIKVYADTVSPKFKLLSKEGTVYDMQGNKTVVE